MPEKILITGASGFIGSHLVETGLHKGYEIFAGTRAQSSHEFLANPNIRFFRVPLDSPSELENQLWQFKKTEGAFDYVIHCAGITYSKDREDFERVNTLGTINLVEALIKTSTISKKFIFISSLAAMGPGEPVLRHPISLEQAPNPVSAYGKSKLAAEKYLESQSLFPSLILRPTAVYGPRDRDFLSYFKLISKGIEPSIGLHKQILSLIYVTDLCQAVYGLLGLPQDKGTFLVSDGNNYPKEQLGMAIRHALGKKTLRIKIPLAPLKTIIYGLEALYSIFGQRPFLNVEKLDEISAANWGCEGGILWQKIGLSPTYSMQEGIHQTAEWYMEQRWL